MRSILILRRPAALAAALLLTSSAAGQAPDPPPPAFQAKVAYLGEYARNLAGGIRGGGALQGLVQLGAAVDTGAAGWWSGGRLFLRGIHLHGSDPGTNRVGVFQTATNIEGPSTTRLDRLGYDHAFADSGLSLRLAMYDLSDEFTVAGPAGAFLNSSFGFQPDLGLNLSLSTYPISALGLRVAWESEAVDLRAAVFDGKPATLDDRDHGRFIHLSAGDGAFVLAEAAWRPAPDDSAGAELKLGAWRHSDDFRDLRAIGPAPRFDGNHGFYAVGSSCLAGDPEGRRLDGFFKTGWAPEDRNPVALFLGGGLVWRGPLEVRPDDEAGLAVARVNFSHPWRQHSGVAAHETVVELSYRFDLGDHLALRPDLQWIRHPSVAPGLDDAWLALLRVEIVF
ncbi:MAG: carbohydrate porin [Planctomycetes bacterium]|nr:carbohydrate porin [Planctomycetota bacterium]